MLILFTNKYPLLYDLKFLYYRCLMENNWEYAKAGQVFMDLQVSLVYCVSEITAMS